MDESILDTIVFDYLTHNQKILLSTARKRIEQLDVNGLRIKLHEFFNSRHRSFPDSEYA